MENALSVGARLTRSRSRRAGVLVRVFWGDRRLASEFLPFDQPRGFSVGLEEGCDFVASGVRRFELVRVDRDGAVVRFASRMSGARVGPEGETPLAELAGRDEAPLDGEAHALRLERRDVVRVEVGALSFEVLELHAPPLERGELFEGVDFTWANLTLALFALMGLFALYAANREEEGAPLADDLGETQLRLVKVLERVQPPRPSAAPEAVAKPAKEGKMAGPPDRARPLKPNTAEKPGRNDMKQLVSKLFANQGHGLFAPGGGLGDELAKNVGGIVGAGLGGQGLGLKGDGNGFGGTLEGIGTIGVHGRGKGSPYGYGTGIGCGMNCKDSVVPIPPPEVKIICGREGTCLDKELIRKVIHENIGKFRYCYESRLTSNPKLAGKVSVRFGIESSGRVATSNVVQSTAGDPELDRCVAERTRLLNFPSRKSDGLVLVTYPFVFRAGAQ